MAFDGDVAAGSHLCLDTVRCSGGVVFADVAVAGQVGDWSSSSWPAPCGIALVDWLSATSRVAQRLTYLDKSRWFELDDDAAE